MGQWLSKLWPEAPNPSLVEIEARQRAEADAEQARKDVEAAQAEFTALIQSNQESQKKAMEDKLAAIQAAQEHAHKEMMAKVEAERAANEAARAQAHKEMMAMVQAENEARSMAETAAKAANEEARQRAAEEEERKRTFAAQEQVERDARQVQAHEEMMATMEAERAAHEAHLKAKTAAHEEEKQRAAAEAEEEQRRTAAVQEQAIKDAQEYARKVEDAAKEDKRKNDEAADALKKAAEEEVNKANAAREDVERKFNEEVKRAEEDAERKLKDELKRAEEDAERKLKVEVKKANDAERKLKEGIQPMVTPTAEEVRDTKRRVHYREDLFHLAVAGAAGGGKSSLINAFRGLRNNDPRAAATGVTETTMDITRYANPDEDLPYVWYDIPGAGTSKIPDWLYFNAQGLYIFDCIIVMFDSRFTMADIAILINCRRFNIPMYIVRSKADQHIRNLMEDLPVGYGSKDGDKDREMKKLYQTARKKFIQETRQSVKINLEDANIPDQKVYIVSKETLVGVVEEQRPKEVIDEIELLNDLVWEGQARRGQRDAGAVTVIKDMLQSITSI